MSFLSHKGGPCIFWQIVLGLLAGATALRFYCHYPNYMVASIGGPVFVFSMLLLVIWLLLLGHAVCGSAMLRSLLCGCGFYLFLSLLGALATSLLAMGMPWDCPVGNALVLGFIVTFVTAVFVGLIFTVWNALSALCPSHRCN